MTSSIDTKEIDILLKLFRQLSDLIISEPPEKNKELWEQCLKQAEKEIFVEIKEHESRLSARTPPRKAHKEDEEEFQKALQHNTTKIAEEKYRKIDSKYDKACSQIEGKKVKIVRDIDHFLYSVREPLLKFGRVNGTLLKADWKRIRDSLTIDDITHPNFHFYVQEAIDALEAIKAKIERQQEKTEIEASPTETERNTTPSKKEKGDVNVNIFGPVQARKLQIAQDASIHEQSVIKEKKKGILRKILKIIGAIVGFLATLLGVLYYLDYFGWLERVRCLFKR